MSEENNNNNGKSNSEAELKDIEQENTQEVIASLQRFGDVKLTLMATMGKIEMPIEQYLKLVRGSIIDLGKTEDINVIININGADIAESEITVLDEKIGCQIERFVKPSLNID